MPENSHERPYYFVKAIKEEEIRFNRATELTGTNTKLMDKLTRTNRMLEREMKKYRSTLQKYTPRALRSFQFGHSVEVNGQRILEYEFDARDPRSILSAMFQRQFKPTCRPDAHFIARFTRDFMDGYVAKWEEHCRKLADQMLEGKFKTLDPVKWTKKYPATKAARYHRCLIAQSEKPETIGTGAVDFICKTGEVQTTVDPAFDDEGLLLGVRERTRLICPGDDSFTGWYVYTTTILSEAMKSFDPSYRIGDNLPQLTTLLRRQASDFANPVVVCMDGSAWDSTQFRELLKTIDYRVIQAASPLIESFLVTQKAYFPEMDIARMKESILKALTDPLTKCVIHLPGIDKQLNHSDPNITTMKNKLRQLSRDPTDRLLITIQDGVVSGKCVMTTFGNTIRTIVAHRYNAQLAGIRDFHIHAAGDDCVIILEEKNANKMRQQILSNSHRSALSTEARGFGNVYEQATIGPLESYDFCSKNIFLDENSRPQNLTRDIMKFLTTKQNYTSNESLDIRSYISALNEAA